MLDFTDKHWNLDGFLYNRLDWNFDDLLNDDGDFNNLCLNF